MHEYDSGFYEYINRGSVSSAKVVIPLLTRLLPVKSVLDVGCGQGAWLKVWRESGVEDICGLDGAYVDQDRLLVPPEQFRSMDLSQPFQLGRRFDMVQSLEVAEHLPEKGSRDFVASLVAHAAIVYFSAATPGQGGEHHVNEKPPSFWRGIFAEHDYHMADFIRPQVAGNSGVEPWYRYNSFVYVSTSILDTLPDEIRSSILPGSASIPEFAPPSYRYRSAVLRYLPVPAVTCIAKAKHAVVRMRYRMSGS